MSDVMPKISVVIPCYNHGAYLAETLDSVQAQTYANYEVIVVNDGSTDATTMALLQSLSRPRTRVIHTTNQGVSAARNRGIEEARGGYILPLDADDIIGPSYLEKAVELLDTRPDVAVVFCERVMFGERNGVTALPDYEPRALLVENLIYPAAVFRKSDWKKVGGYSEKMIYGWEDWDFWISISMLNKSIVKLPDKLFYYRVSSVSRDHSLRFLQKLMMLGIMMWRHKRLYWNNIVYVVARLSATHIFRLRR